MPSWFRSWHGAPTDPKWRVIARLANADLSVVIAGAWALLDHASQCPDRGSIANADPDVIAESIGTSAEVVERVIEAMHAKNILHDNKFAAWEERQPKREDDCKDRVTQHRERKRNAVKRTVTQCNAPDTDTETETEERGNARAALRSTERPREIPPDTSDLYDAVLTALMLDRNCSQRSWQGVQKVVACYAAAGRSPEFVRRQAEWFRTEHWIGKRGEAPSADNLIDTAIQFANIEKANGKARAKPPPAILTPEQIEKRDRALRERQALVAAQMERMGVKATQ